MTEQQKCEMFLNANDTVVIVTINGEYQINTTKLISLTLSYNDIVISNAYITLTNEQIQEFVSSNIFKPFDMREYLDSLQLGYANNDAATY